MKKSTNTLIIILVFVGLMVGAYFLYGNLKEEAALDNSPPENENISAPDATEPPKIAAEDFTVYDRDGNEVKLSDFKGKPVVLNFWASWCYYCKQEMPDFDDVYAESGEDVVFMMVNLTSGKETLEKAQSYVDNSGYAFPVYYDTSADAAIVYGISSLPTTLFIDADGYIASGYQGMISKETLTENIGLLTADSNEPA